VSENFQQRNLYSLLVRGENSILYVRTKKRRRHKKKDGKRTREGEKEDVEKKVKEGKQERVRGS
jgi:hypothetical protein